MKRLKSIFMAAAALGVVGLTSCSKDNNDPIITDFLTFDVNGGYIEPGDSIEVSATLTDAEGLEEARFSVETNGTSVGTVTTTGLSGTNETYKTYFVVPSTAQNGQVYRLKLTVQDDDKDAPLTDFAEEDITVGVVNVAPDFTGTAWTGVTLEASTSTAANMIVFVNLASGTTYTVQAGASNQNQVDLAYFYGSSNGDALAAPDDENIDGSNANSFEFTQGWASPNQTRLVSANNVDFDNATDADIAALSTFTASIVPNLAAGNVVGFVTASGKKGLIKINSVAGSTTGSASLDIKIQN